MGETYSTYGEKIYSCRILMGKPEGQRPLGRHKRRWKEIVKLDLYEMRWHGVDSSGAG
jgi:hypothetical protein